MTDFISATNVAEKVVVRSVLPITYNKPTFSIQTTTEETNDALNYLEASKSIKWLTDEEKLTIPYAKLLINVQELSQFFYATTEGISTQYDELLEEYVFLEEQIKDDILEAELDIVVDAEYTKMLLNDMPDEELDEEDMHMLSMLLQAGIPTTNLVTSTEILNAYCALTSNNY